MRFIEDFSFIEDVDGIVTLRLDASQFPQPPAYCP